MKPFSFCCSYKYPAIKEFGMPKEETAEVATNEAGYVVVMKPIAS